MLLLKYLCASICDYVIAHESSEHTSHDANNKDITNNRGDGYGCGCGWVACVGWVGWGCECGCGWVMGVCGGSGDGCVWVWGIFDCVILCVHISVSVVLFARFHCTLYCSPLLRVITWLG